MENFMYLNTAIKSYGSNGITYSTFLSKLSEIKTRYQTYTLSFLYQDIAL